MSTITKAHLSNKVAHALACTKAEASSAVNKFLEKLTSEILTRDSILLSGFGRFDRKRKGSRTVRNMKTGEPMIMPARTVVTFSPTGKFRQAINNGGPEPWSGYPSVAKLYVHDIVRDVYAENAGRAIICAIAQALIDGDRVEAREFGTFSVKDYVAYTGRNPKTGEPVEVPAKKLPCFRPGRELLRRANG